MNYETNVEFIIYHNEIIKVDSDNGVDKWDGTLYNA